MTTEEIIDKYPRIFQDYEGNPGRVNWFGIPKGWLPIINDLCGAIQHYIDQHKINIRNPDYDKSIPFSLLNTKSHRYLQKDIQQVTCNSMKEKFGGLAFYVNDADEHVYGLISYATYLCSDTCTHCGSRDDVKFKTKWIEPVCIHCRIEHNYNILPDDNRMLR